MIYCMTSESVSKRSKLSREVVEAVVCLHFLYPTPESVLCQKINYIVRERGRNRGSGGGFDEVRDSSGGQVGGQVRACISRIEMWWV